MFVLLEENNGFNDVTQFEIHEEAIYAKNIPNEWWQKGSEKCRTSDPKGHKNNVKKHEKNTKNDVWKGC